MKREETFLDRFIPMPFSDPDDNNFIQMAGDNNNNNTQANCIDNMPLAMAYVPMQKWNTTYEPDAGFNNGTIFPELNLPWLGRGE